MQIIPQWQVDQAREMDRRLFEQNMKLANEHTYKALHGPVRGRDVARARAKMYLSRAMAFAKDSAEC